MCDTVLSVETQRNALYCGETWMFEVVLVLHTHCIPFPIFIELNLK